MEFTVPLELEQRHDGRRGWSMIADTARVGAWTVAVKIAGAAKVVIAARIFGAGDAMDAYLVALLAPLLLAEVLAGPLDAALVPRLIELRDSKGKDAASELSSSALTWIASALLFVAAAMAATSSWLLRIVGSSFAPEKLALTHRLFLLVVLVVPLSGLSIGWRAILNSERKFTLSAAIPLLTPLASILALAVAGKSRGVIALAAGTMAGALLETLASGWAARRAGYRIVPLFYRMTPELRVAVAQYAPLVAIAVVMTGSAVFDQAMAARLGSGSVAVLSYGTRLMGVLIAIGPAAVGTVVLPYISGIGSRWRGPAGRGQLHIYGALILGAILPGIAALMFFSAPIVRILFQGGAFTESATQLVAGVQRISLMQVPIAVLLALETRLTSATGGNRILYRVAALNLILNVVLDLLLMRSWAVAGLALAGVAARTVSTLYLSCKIYRLGAKQYGFAADDGLS